MKSRRTKTASSTSLIVVRTPSVNSECNLVGALVVGLGRWRLGGVLGGGGGILGLLLWGGGGGGLDLVPGGLLLVRGGGIGGHRDRGGGVGPIVDASCGWGVLELLQAPARGGGDAGGGRGEAERHDQGENEGLGLHHHHPLFVRSFVRCLGLRGRALLGFCVCVGRAAR